MSQNDFIPITEDGGVLKKILTPSTSEEIPQNDQKVEVLYVGRLEDGTLFDQCQLKDDAFTFVLGAGRVIKGWDIGVKTMKKGEKSLFKLAPSYAYGANGSPPKIPPNATLLFEIELLAFSDEEKSKWDYTMEQRIEMAFTYKEEGNAHFKKAEYEEARKKYDKTLEFIEDEKGEKVKQLKITCFLNLSAVYFKLSLFLKSIEHASRALEADPASVKALYRRGMAYASFSDFESGLIDFQDALKLDPNNSDIKNEIANLLKQKKKSADKEKAIFGKLFSQNYYEKVEICEYSEEHNPRVYFDVQVEGEEKDRIEFELFKNLVPKTVENFLKLCTDGIEEKEGKKFSYKDTIFHRLIKGFMIQGGDFENANGTGGKSIYGGKFDDENFKAKHKGRGYLSMANAGPNTNGSQFFITFKNTNWLDGKHVVFGVISNGMSVLDKLENQECEGEKPKKTIKIVDCGVIVKN